MPNMDELVETHFRIKAKVEALKAEHKSLLAPYEGALDKVKGALVEALDEMGVENVKTAHGTPYFSHPATYKVSDKETYLNWLMERKAFDLVPDTIARKEAVREELDDGEASPPGVEVTTVRLLCVRKN